MPLVAERNGTAGPWRRFYVYTPHGRLLYAIEPGTPNRVRFYHFDRIGSTVALTDGTGTLTDAYAHNPYGRTFRHTGTSDQPFTFVGQWGVRQEGTDGRLYQMRFRYYDAETAQFLSRDPVQPDLADPQSVNPYTYAADNPVLYIDPTGQRWVLAQSGEHGAPKRPGRFFRETVRPWTWVGYAWLRCTEELSEPGRDPRAKGLRCWRKKTKSGTKWRWRRRRGRLRRWRRRVRGRRLVVRRIRYKNHTRVRRRWQRWNRWVRRARRGRDRIWRVKRKWKKVIWERLHWPRGCWRGPDADSGPQSPCQGEDGAADCADTWL